MAVDDREGWNLLVPFFGRFETKAGKQILQMRAGQEAALLPNSQRTMGGTARAGVSVILQIEVLRATVETMHGEDAPLNLLDVGPQTIDMSRQRETFPAFRQICDLIELTAENPRYSEMLGIEDILYRWLANALRPCSEIDSTAERQEVPHHKLDLTCDLVKSSHSRPVTLTEMEALSGLSARMLQYAFKSRFGCSPMEWQRRERIQMARKQLLFAQPGETITQIAFAMGFSSSAAFADQYRRYFGETPSQTVRSRG